MLLVRRACLGETVSTVQIPSTPFASFSTDSSVPLASLVADVTAYQSGSGDPSPDNIRPLTGYSGVTVWRTGKNLVDMPRMCEGGNITYNSARLTASYSDGVLTGVVQNNGSYTRDITVAMAAANQVVLPKGFSGYLTMSFYHDGMLPNSSNILRAQLKYANNTTSFGNTPYNSSRYVMSTSNLSWAAGRTISGIYIAATYNASASIGDEIEFQNLQVEYADSNPAATDYEAASITTYPISFPDGLTVYGGSVDVLHGTLTVTHGEIASYDGETINGPWISSMDVYTPDGTPTTGAQVVYPLTVPQQYQLTPTAISSLAGQNHVWADTGNVTLEYLH